GYYDQHQAGLTPDKTVLDEVWDRFPRMEQTEIRGALGLFLFSGDDVFQPIHTLSGGEMGRVALTELMLRRDNVLLLDEPTNHLDMDSREVLEEALDDFNGTLLTVSHDRYFMNRIATRILEMQPDGVREYLGNYDDYLEKKRQEALPVAEVSTGKTRTELDREKKRDRVSREKQRAAKARVAELERAIQKTEEDIALQEAVLADPGTYSDATLSQQAAHDYQRLQEALVSLYEEWEAADEQA
ncbi:MAG: ATP-binding cassette domain-containing protein, partial [Clostridia bacterium]